MMAAIESAEGVLNAPAIAKSSTPLDWHRVRRRRLCYQYENTAPLYSMITAIDTVYSDVSNTEGFEAEVRLIKQLGFDGKSVINPRQIPLVNTIYAPTEKERTKSNLGHSGSRSKRFRCYLRKWKNG